MNKLYFHRLKYFLAILKSFLDIRKSSTSVSCTKKTGNNQARFQQIVMRKLCCFRFAKEYVDEDTESESSDDTMAESEDDNDVESGDVLIS